MRNSNLVSAKSEKNDEFYTQYSDIEKEINYYLEFDADIFKDKIILLPCDSPKWSNFTKYFIDNFELLGLKKLISTSYSPNDRGKILTLDTINFEKNYGYLSGDGDFRSDEISELRNQADFIITNPPFSLFRSFLEWINVSDKKFLLIGNMNAISYKEVFPLIRDNKLWLGKNQPKEFLEPTGLLKKFGNIIWFTNIEHGIRLQPLLLTTMEDIKSSSKHKELIGKDFDKYENFDAIDIPFTDSIPIDYDGIMGVPISFLTKYNPNQFEIIGLGISSSGTEIGVNPYTPEHKKYRIEIQKSGAVNGDLYIMENNVVKVPYARILIRRKQ